ncbi:peptidase inhibitor family I36 protein [Amycolatopsis sp. NPDC051372]|uniref:peptidase inhibitor family I36 protein n=1 Tax=Amycolatopsis sp. NPDC051372 TaxID=3155669 RepID=UPI00344A15C4
MSKIRSVAAIAAAVAGVAAGTVLAAAPASAATAPCPANYYCFYQDKDYNAGVYNQRWHLNYSSTPSGSFNNPPQATKGDRRSQLSSIINNGNRTICLYNHRGVLGDKLILKVSPFKDYKNLVDIPGANDKADSWKINAC